MFRLTHLFAIPLVDTPNWYNGYIGAHGGKGYTCADYVSKGWCANRGIVAGHEWSMGPAFKYPEGNCVACGKGC